MIEVLVGTNRKEAKSSSVGAVVLRLYQELKVEAGLLDLKSVPLVCDSDHNYKVAPGSPLAAAIDRVNKASGLVVICPEYNGSYPGILKYFIDHWSYPQSFEFRPVCFVGLGGRFGGLRPVEHLQGVFGYRNAFVFPQRVFLFNIWDQFNSGELPEDSMKLLKDQASGFIRFIRGLESEGLTANSRLKS